MLQCWLSDIMQKQGMVIWMKWIKTGMKFWVVFATLCQMTSGLDFGYHGNEDMTNYLQTMSTTYPELTHLYSIGKTVQNRDLWVLAIGRNSQSHVTLRPHVKYVGNMHGNEVVSREVLLHLIDYYLTSYSTNSTIKTFLDNTVVHILASMNPDGFSVAVEGKCTGVVGRNNAADYDLNRNFPGYFEVNPAPIQPETQAVMDWLKQYKFILSANLHGGAMVANYPFDNYVNGSKILQIRYVRSPDDATFVHLSKVYSYSHQTMFTGLHCNDRFPQGITNGAWWYPVLGGMQDYNYVREGCMEITLEIGCCKYPNASDLPQYWIENKDALVNFHMSVHSGLKGIVFNNDTIVPNVKMSIKGRELITFKSSQYGEYWRILQPGVHVLQVIDGGGSIIAQKEVTITGQNVVRADIHIGDEISIGANMKSYLPLLISLLSICVYTLGYLTI